MSGLYESDRSAYLKVAELGETIFMAESNKVPFTRLLPRGGKPVDMLARWPVRNYPSRAARGTIDGTDQTTFNSVESTPLLAYGQWTQTEGWMVSKLRNLTATAGTPIGKAKADQAYLDTQILAQMLEKSCLSDQETQAEDRGNAASYRQRGAFQWLSKSEQSVLPVPAAFRPTAGLAGTTIAAITQDVFEAELAKAAIQKREAVSLTGYVGITLKAKMTSWTVRDVDASATDKALRMYTMDASEKKLIRVCDMFEFEAGSVATFPSFYALNDLDTGLATAYSPRSGIFIDLAMWELCWYEEPSTFELPPQTGGPRGCTSAVHLLKCLNPMGQFSVTAAS